MISCKIAKLYQMLNLFHVTLWLNVSWLFYLIDHCLINFFIYFSYFFHWKPLGIVSIFTTADSIIIHDCSFVDIFFHNLITIFDWKFSNISPDFFFIDFLLLKHFQFWSINKTYNLCSRENIQRTISLSNNC